MTTAPGEDGAVRLEVKAITASTSEQSLPAILGGQCVDKAESRETPVDEPSAVQRSLDELLSAEQLSFSEGSEQLSPEGKSTTEKVAAILRNYPDVPVKIMACTEKPPETTQGLTVRFQAATPQEPSELPLMRARSLRALLQMGGCSNPMAAQGMYDVGDRCSIAVAGDRAVAEIEGQIEESLRDVEVIFVRKPAGMRLAHSKPLEVWTISAGGHAAELGVQRGWRVKSIGGKQTDDLPWEDGIALMLQSLDTLPI